MGGGGGLSGTGTMGAAQMRGAAMPGDTNYVPYLPAYAQANRAPMQQPMAPPPQHKKVFYPGEPNTPGANIPGAGGPLGLQTGGTGGPVMPGTPPPVPGGVVPGQTFGYGAGTGGSAGGGGTTGSGGNALQANLGGMMNMNPSLASLLPYFMAFANPSMFAGMNPYMLQGMRAR